MATNDFTWLTVPAEQAAQRLLNCELISTVASQMVRVRIVEVEAYDQYDEASHTFRGRSPRNAVMFDTAGHLYVYFTYGMHHCCNVVCGEEGFGSGVLVRAAEPLDGGEVIGMRRGGISGKHATNGPGKVAQALGINLSHNGHFLARKPLRLIERPALATDDIVVTKRVGISKALDEPRRFYIAGNPYVSKK